MGAPTCIPQNDPHGGVIILNRHNWGKTFCQKLFLPPIRVKTNKIGSRTWEPILNPPPTILGLPSPPPPTPKQISGRPGSLKSLNLKQTSGVREAFPVVHFNFFPIKFFPLQHLQYHLQQHIGMVVMHSMQHFKKAAICRDAELLTWTNSLKLRFCAAMMRRLGAGNSCSPHIS